jgi:hypothetical protein
MRVRMQGKQGQPVAEVRLIVSAANPTVALVLLPRGFTCLVQASYLEGTIFDQLHRHPQGQQPSAMQVLADANRERGPIYRITARILALNGCS